MADFTGEQWDEIQRVIHHAFGTIVADVARELGESPEAWRGAKVMSQLVMAGIDIGSEMPVESEAKGSVLTIMMILAVWGDHPLARQAFVEPKAYVRMERDE